MSQMRFNTVTRDWVIMAGDRAGKPNDFSESSSPRPRMRWRQNCPFCPGNEAETPDEISRIDDGTGNWLIRVVANRYPAFQPEPELCREVNSTFLSMRAAGRHEVVVEHPRHDLNFASAGPGHLARLIRVFRERYAALRELEHTRIVTVFRNHGVRAGTSLKHPHSQIAAAPIVPPRMRLRMQDARRFHEETGACLFCQVIEDELAAGERLVEISPLFLAFVPFAALSPYHQWIFPRRHAASFDSISDAEIDDLGRVLNRMALRMRDGIGDPDFNLSIRSAPTGAGEAPFFHWYVALVPRISRVAGFEMGSGMYINTVLPERAAEDLRSVELDP